MNLRKISLYLNTVRYLKPSQVYYRVRKTLNMNCSLGAYPKSIVWNFVPTSLDTIKELDFDPAFLARFPVEETMADKVTFLYESEIFHWDESWNFPNHTPLWNYNLHYFEYLFPLVKAYKDTGGRQYTDKIKAAIGAWIKQNPRGTRPGWDSYPIALRLTNWLSIYTHLETVFKDDEQFRKNLIRSVWEQYDYLTHHLEKDLLGNHYFEDLKALILCSLFFSDEKMLNKSLDEFYKQCREQILPDGMHFELSPMYHKLIFENVMRVAFALRKADKRDGEIEGYLQPMLDVAYSLEEGLERIPLFNDCGNNVTKSLDALCKAAKIHFDLMPNYKDKLPDSGYYIFKQGEWKLIVDAGQPGPIYLPGHAHCDAMSFELFKAGKPIIVNCGTYAYQCDERAFFRSTAAHNTVQIDDVEQSECWGVFRMGKRSWTQVKAVGDDFIEMEMIDQQGNFITRNITWKDCITVSDFAESRTIEVYLHFFENFDDCEIISDGLKLTDKCIYANEFGKRETISQLHFSAKNRIDVQIKLKGDVVKCL